MSRNWHQRRHGWTCPDCLRFNSEDDFACQCAHDAADREQARWERCNKRWEPRDKIVARSDSGVLYRVRRYTSRRFDEAPYRHGVLVYTVLVSGGYSYRVDRYRVPASVVRQAVEHFFGVKLP